MPRPLCSVCDLPLRACLCACVRPVAHATPLRVLQHPAEAGHAKNSLRLLRLCLSDCQVSVSEQLPDSMKLQGAALLYPGGEPLPVGQRPSALWLLDGSWRQSRALLRANPRLAALPRFSLPEPQAQPAYAALRRAQRPGQCSTLEAAALALAHLEGETAMAQTLLGAFDDWLGLQRRLRPSTRCNAARCGAACRP